MLRSDCCVFVCFVIADVVRYVLCFLFVVIVRVCGFVLLAFCGVCCLLFAFAFAFAFVFAFVLCSRLRLLLLLLLRLLLHLRLFLIVVFD